MPSSNGSLASASPTGDSPTKASSSASENLARKRARDRKSQRAMRDRTKWTMDDLQNRVDYLSETLAMQASSLQELQSQLRASEQNAARLEAENRNLKSQAEEARFIGSELSLETVRFPSSECIWGGLPLPRPVRRGSELSGVRRLSITNLNSTRNLGWLQPPIYESIPWNMPPTCISDRIVQGYIEVRRNGMDDNPGEPVQFLDEQSLPNINALLTPTQMKEGKSVSNVVADILLSYTEINTLPKKIACLYVMYKLLNWMIYRTPSTYQQLPAWLRPEPVQLQIQHPAWIDRIPWPRARVYLIAHPEITFDDFAIFYSSNFEVSWPYSPSHAIISPPCDAESAGERNPGGAVTLNPVYEQHLRQLRNWTVGEKFKRKFPELSAIIDQDSKVDFGM